MGKTSTFRCHLDLHHICYLLLGTLLLLNHASKSSATIQELYSMEDQEAYVKYYKQFPGPLQNFTNDALLMVAKCAELTVKEYNNQSQVAYQLRHITKAQIEEQDNLVKLQVVVESDSHGYHEMYFEAKSLLTTKYITSSMMKAAVIPKKGTHHCDKLSSKAGCTECTLFKRCVKGHVPSHPWLDFALKTQQEIQIDQEFPKVQLLAAHNAFNDRADHYGVLDDCPWPPPYDAACLGLANQEFSLTDMLNMGIRSLEIDPWWCFGNMRMSHASVHAIGCGPTDRLFVYGMKEIGEWVHKPENAGIIIRIYFEDGSDHTKGHDDLINGPIKKYFGDRVFTPTDRKQLGRWPTLREMRNLNKTVLVTSANSYTHGSVFIQEGYWNEYIRKEFTPYPACGQASSSSVLRYYCDSTNYGPFWNERKQTGVIIKFSEFKKYADQINPKLLETAVWTWAKGQPSQPLTIQSCVFLDGTSHRWYLAPSCDTLLPHACISSSNSTVWVLGSKASYGDINACPKGFHFSLPVNGFHQQKLIEVASNQSVWLNMTSYLPQLV
eukprot:XP_011670833.1 PREDICTED: uncharacterized protein LOC100893701 [Strongylocentrotus purpuratus]